MIRTSWVELCVSDFEQSIIWFEQVLGFHVVAREANDYAELARGETFIQLATDDAPYWETEHPHLLPAGQRGSGVEIVLLVENADAVYRQAQDAQADIVRPIADYPWHMRQFWVRHPDGYLIRPAQKLLSINPAVYRRQVIAAFQQEAPSISEELLPVKQAADQLAQQGDVLGAATIYETLVNEILEQSHLYFEEGTDEDNYYREEEGYPEEEGLDDLVEECIEALGTSLADPQSDRIAREKIIDVLFAIYQYDVNEDDHQGFYGSVLDQLVDYAHPVERHALATRVHDLLTNDEEDIDGSQRQIYGQLLLALQHDELDDESYLRICRETGRTSDLIERLVTLGRIDEAVHEMQPIKDYFLTTMADLLLQHGHDAVAERAVRARLTETPALNILRWLQNYYREKGNASGELEIVERWFRIQPYVERYQELRTLAQQLNRWETLRSEVIAHLEQASNNKLLIEISLYEGDLDNALQRLKSIERQDKQGYIYEEGRYSYFGQGTIALVVAKAAEEARPHEAIELYRRYAERLIALRSRRNYQEACKYIAKMRVLYEKLNEDKEWTSYITTVRQKHHALRALMEELTKAGL